jgi:hypothetical protein
MVLSLPIEYGFPATNVPFEEKKGLPWELSLLLFWPEKLQFHGINSKRNFKKQGSSFF